MQPTTPIGGYAAGGEPGEPDELGSRESARAVLSAMLETPADPGGASAGGGGINLQSAWCWVWHGAERVMRGCGMVWHDRHGAEMVHHDPLCSMVLGECGQSHDPGTLS